MGIRTRRARKHANTHAVGFGVEVHIKNLVFSKLLLHLDRNV